MSWNHNLRIGVTRDGRFLGVVCVAAWLAFLAYVARLSDVTHDAFHEMALVRAFFETGDFPTKDIFAFTPTVAPAVHHEWGTGLFLYLVAGASPLGLHGMAVSRVLLIALLGLGIFRVARNAGAHPLLIGLCAPIAFPLAWVGFATLRAQLLTLVFLVLQILLQQSDWQKKKTWIATWFLLYVVWLNVHAGFVVGLGMLGFHMLERWFSAVAQKGWHAFTRSFVFEYWHHLLLLPMIGLGLVLNPWGMDYPLFLFHAIQMPRPTMIEWQPLWKTHDAYTTMLCFCGMVFGLGYAVTNRRILRMRGWVFTCVAAYMALKHIRHGSIFAVLWMAYMPGWCSGTALGHTLLEWLRKRRSLVQQIAWSVSLACTLFAIMHPVWRVTIPASDPGGVMVYPVGAVEYMKSTRFRGNLMTPFVSGAYVSWHCYPNVLVSLDGRYEVAYREDVLPKHDQFYSATGDWQRILEELSADAILVQQNAPVRGLLGRPESKTEHFRLVYEDATFALYLQDSLSVRTSGLEGESQSRWIK